MRFVRVRDKDTGHHVDVPETDWRIDAGIFVPLKSVGPSHLPRAAKHRKPSKGVKNDGD